MANKGRAPTNKGKQYEREACVDCGRMVAKTQMRRHRQSHEVSDKEVDALKYALEKAGASAHRFHDSMLDLAYIVKLTFPNGIPTGDVDKLATFLMWLDETRDLLSLR